MAIQLFPAVQILDPGSPHREPEPGQFGRPGAAAVPRRLGHPVPDQSPRGEFLAQGVPRQPDLVVAAGGDPIRPLPRGWQPFQPLVAILPQPVFKAGRGRGLSQEIQCHFGACPAVLESADFRERGGFRGVQSLHPKIPGGLRQIALKTPPPHPGAFVRGTLEKLRPIFRRNPPRHLLAENAVGFFVGQGLERQLEMLRGQHQLELLPGRGSEGHRQRHQRDRKGEAVPPLATALESGGGPGEFLRGLLPGGEGVLRRHPRAKPLAQRPGGGIARGRWQGLHRRRDQGIVDGLVFRHGPQPNRSVTGRHPPRGPGPVFLGTWNFPLGTSPSPRAAHPHPP